MVKENRTETRIKFDVPHTVYSRFKQIMDDNHLSVAELVRTSLRHVLKDPEEFAEQPFFRLKKGSVAKHALDGDIPPEEKKAFVALAKALNVNKVDLFINIVARTYGVDLAEYSALMKKGKIENPDFDLLYDGEAKASEAAAIIQPELGVTPKEILKNQQSLPQKVVRWQDSFKTPDRGMKTVIPEWKR